MSLLLDALKRAEEAKRAKLSVDSGKDAEGGRAATAFTPGSESNTTTTDARASAASAEPDFSLEDYKEFIPARSNRSAIAAKSASVEPPHGSELSLENIADARPEASLAEQGRYVAATTAAPVAQSKLDAATLDAAQSRETARNVFVAKQATASDGASGKKWLLPVIAVLMLAVGGGGWYVWNEVNRTSRPTPNFAARPLPTQE